jgi:transposase
MQIATIGVDLAKHVFQIHGVGPNGCVVLRKKLRRAQVMSFFAGLPPCLVGMEACATAHHWARELRTLGHEVRLMPAHYVKAYIKLCPPVHNLTKGHTYYGAISFTSCPAFVSSRAQ